VVQTYERQALDSGDVGHNDFAPSLFLVAHDPFTGRSDINRDLLVCGLAASQLAHLIISRRIEISGGRVVVSGAGPNSVPQGAAGSGPPRRSDLLIDNFVIDSLRREDSPHGVSAWCVALGEQVYGLVSDALVEAGVLRRVDPRRGVTGRSAARFPAVDVLTASSPRLELDHMVREPATATLARAVNLALIARLGIESVLEAELTRDYVDQLHHTLPTQLQMLMIGVAGVAGAVSPLTAPH
jgi:hypothetical protein